jgi:hypothetical protein
VLTQASRGREADRGEAGAVQDVAAELDPPLGLAGVERPELGAAPGGDRRDRAPPGRRPGHGPVGPPVLRDLVATLAAFVQPGDEIPVQAQRRAFPRAGHHEECGRDVAAIELVHPGAGRPRGRRSDVVDRDDQRRPHAARTRRMSIPRRRS